MENLRIDLLQRFETLKYLDKYEALQILEDLGRVCLTDMETIQLEGLKTLKETQPIGGGGELSKLAKIAKCEGRILPLDLIASHFFKAQNAEIIEQEERLESILADKQALILSLEPEEVQECLGYFDITEESQEEQEGDMDVKILEKCFQKNETFQPLLSLKLKLDTNITQKSEILSSYPQWQFLIHILVLVVVTIVPTL